MSGITPGRGSKAMWGAAVVLAGAMSLAACEKKPGGQVVAVVDGEEITQQELRAEADAAQVPANQDIRKIDPSILQRVIDRNLLADYARDQGLDRGPEFIARRRQIEQTLLASLAIRKIAGTPVKPSDAEVQRFIAAQPTIFAQRQRLVLDQVRFATPANPRHVQELTKLQSIDAVQAQLRSEGITAERSRPVLDTASVAPSITTQILALKPGTVFDFTANGVSFISTVVERQPAATASTTWAVPAAEALRREKMDQTVKQGMEKIRSSAKIDYDPAFKPAAAPTPAVK